MIALATASTDGQVGAAARPASAGATLLGVVEERERVVAELRRHLAATHAACRELARRLDEAVDTVAALRAEQLARQQEQDARPAPDPDAAQAAETLARVEAERDAVRAQLSALEIELTDARQRLQVEEAAHDETRERAFALVEQEREHAEAGQNGTETEGRAQEAEHRAQEAERRAQEAERRAQEAERRAQEAERRADDLTRQLAAETARAAAAGRRIEEETVRAEAASAVRDELSDDLRIVLEARVGLALREIARRDVSADTLRSQFLGDLMDANLATEIDLDGEINLDAELPED